MPIKSKYTEGLFIHTTRNTAFTLVVDYFAIKYLDKDGVDHLLANLWQKYPVKACWGARQYIGINLKWNYDNQ